MIKDSWENKVGNYVIEQKKIAFAELSKTELNYLELRRGYKISKNNSNIK